MENPLLFKEKLWIKVQNIVTKGETDQSEQLPHLPGCFQKLYAADVSKSVNQN